MSTDEAAHSMREAARRMEAWANAAKYLTPEDVARLCNAFRREAERLRNDAFTLAPMAAFKESRLPRVGLSEID